MQQAGSWRELLSECLPGPQERQRLATALGVRSVTLSRWISGESLPRSQHLRQLVAAIPSHHRKEFIALLERDIPGVSIGISAEAGVPVPRSVRATVLCDLILQQAINHLDPHRLGVAISIALCLPSNPAGGPVRSLLANMGRGTAPWEQNMAPETMLLGAESLAGYAVAAGRRAAIADLQAEGNLVPAALGAWEMSVAGPPSPTRVAWRGAWSLPAPRAIIFPRFANNWWPITRTSSPWRSMRRSCWYGSSSKKNFSSGRQRAAVTRKGSIP